MVGCSLGSSRLWFTIGGGIINEVYYPRVDLPQIRDLGFGLDGWQEVREEGTTANSLGLHVVEIDTSRLAAGRHIDLTYRAGSNWIGRDFRVLVTPASPAG
jgi:GH15 family glucan-1,4-alpha-glucosidase